MRAARAVAGPSSRPGGIGMVHPVPVLEGDALRAVKHSGSHMQIIASAGAGKTEAVAQRVVRLISDGVPPESIVAFTFTERAAESLKTRIEHRVEAILGRDSLNRLNGCFVGTIHSFCFRLLQEYVPEYAAYDVLDEHRLAAFLAREASRLGIKGLTGKLYDSIRVFTANVEVVDNELLEEDLVPGQFGEILKTFRERLGVYRYLTYGQLIAKTVAALENDHMKAKVSGRLRHLIVDEYQDVNPAQEELIRLLSQPPVELCVVGDDDQSIYQFRGSDVNNIVRFKDRYPRVSTFQMTTNRRSRPAIIDSANEFAKTITGRLPKTMGQHRKRGAVEIVSWSAPTEADEAALIADSIIALHQRGYRYRDIGILVRGSTSLERLLAALSARGIPVQPTSRTGLFKQPEAQLFGRTVAFLADSAWRETQFEWGTSTTLDGLASTYAAAFGLNRGGMGRIREILRTWHAEAHTSDRPTNLIRNFYHLLSVAGVASWDLDDPLVLARVGTLARCSSILVDYESVTRRCRHEQGAPGEVIGGIDRGPWYYRGLATHVQNWALGAYEAFEGEDDIVIDAVDLTTIHKAKGLEWPVVFVPCVSANRFPSSKNGTSKDWRIPLSLFDRTRYEGTLVDERRLFYVAVTRARDWLSVSTHRAVTTRAVASSPFLADFNGQGPGLVDHLALPDPPDESDDDARQLMLTFSELAAFARCGYAYRLRTLIGFQPSLAPELGYGKAVHHVLRLVAEHTRRHGCVPNALELDTLFDSDFYLPAANKSAHREMAAAARRLVDRYVAAYADDLRRVWAVERPFELHLEQAVVSGRADVILDLERAELALVDYKTSIDDPQEHDLQLRVYAEAGRLEGLNIRGGFVHDLQHGDRREVDLSPAALASSQRVVEASISDLRGRRFRPRPGVACQRCDVREMCRYAV